jgi:heme oxygenase
MIRTRLKEETRPLHLAAERSLDLPNRTHSLDAYTRLVERFFSFHAAAEKRLSRVPDLPATVVDLDARRKTPLLRQDLLSLGRHEAAIAALPLCADLPALDTVAQALGCLYVLEGSTLGGQFICRHLRQSPGIGPEDGARYFNSYGAEVGTMWRRFGETLDSFNTSTEIENTVVRSACDTFAAFGRWFREEPV